MSHTIPIQAETFVSNVTRIPGGKVTQTIVEANLPRAIFDAHKRNPSSRLTILNFGAWDHNKDFTESKDYLESQEMELFKFLPDLKRGLDDAGVYPFHPEQTILWTPKTSFTLHPFEMAPLRNPFEVSVVTVGALGSDRKSPLDSKQFIKALAAAIVVPGTFHVHAKDKDSRTSDNGILVVGVGAKLFDNDMSNLAYWFKRCLQRHTRSFREVIFAIPDPKKRMTFS